MRLNIESSSLRKPSQAGGGGIIRDYTKNRVGGFSKKINGIAISIVAKLWALRDGLLRCHYLHLSVDGIKLNSKAIVFLFLFF